MTGCTIGSPAATGGGGGCAALEGETITLVVPFSPGGGFDTAARIVADPLGEQLNAQVIVENRPGAGGLLAINRLVNGPADGTQIAIMNGTGASASVLGEAEGADFALTDLAYIGRVATENTVLVRAPEGVHRTWEEVRAAGDFRFGSTGPGGADYATATILIEVFELDARIVTGFPGQSEAQLALLQGDIHGLTGPVDDRRAAIEAGELVPVLSVTRERTEIAPDAPAVGEMALGPDQAVLLESLLTLNELGRPLVAPAGIAPDTLTCLREAFTRAATDPEVVARAEQQRRTIGYASGADLEAVVARIGGVPAQFRQLLRDAYRTAS
ncbi:Bug family tripartite tricarboxylate transporter substrate binding protein [Pseudonocardia hierapolitana]|uniref:Bug family tripartite tricarboxylate transporter substrate binding protein n=1 Tax=Pseudonocardia hierapolitana TaxID=1128676 RepID=UPI001479351D|nr:tripartite tricarboxylate transporter substrate-binding protein [Pseudonocardia hierapolitana]